MYHRSSLCASALIIFIICLLTSADTKAIIKIPTENRSICTDRLISTDGRFNLKSSFLTVSDVNFKKVAKPVKAANETKAVKEESKPFYSLTAHERDKIERVLMTSCGDFGYDMAKANAQVILDRLLSKKFGKSVDEVLDAPKQFETPSKGKVTKAVKSAVSDVFDKGQRVTSTPIYYYVNPNLSYISAETWSKGKVYVMTVGKGKYIHEYWTEKH